MRAARIAIAIALIGCSQASAQIYKCTGPDGKINFTDSPCQAAEQVQTIERVPPQGLDKMMIEIEQRRAESAKREAEYQARQAERARKEWQLYMDRRTHKGLRIGMTEEEVTALPQWRGYEDSNITQTAHGVREQRVFRASYDNEYDHMYLYFVNGILTVIQD